MSDNLQGARPAQQPPEAVAATPGQTGQPGNEAARDSQRPPDGTPDDDMRVLLENLSKASEGLGDRNLGLQADIAGLILSMEANPALVQRPDFRRGVAVALQDMERATGRPFTLSEPVRSEMHHLATTMPGVEDSTARELLQATPTIQDQGFVSLIRKTAQSLAAAGDRQSSPQFRGIVDGLANQYRLQAPPQPNGAAPAPVTPQPPAPAQPPAAPSQPAAAPSQPAAALAAADRTRTTQPAPSAHETLPEATRRVIQQRGGAPLPQPTQTAAEKVYNAMRRPIPTGAETVFPLPAGLTKERISLFEARLAEGKTHRLLEDAEKSGARAIEAAEQFVQGPGRGLFRKLESAGRTEFGGVATVVKGMYPGGPHAELRTEFDNAYQQDQAFRGAYDKMVDRVARFGEDREVVAKNYAERNLNPGALDDRFQPADESLERVLSQIPGKQPGKSAREEVTAKVAEILQAAFDRLVSMFRRERDAAPRQQRSAGPGMSP